MTDSIHAAAARGFTDGVDAYERSRPTYPPDAVAQIADLLGLAPCRTLLELGAGTGKLTRLLAPSGARILAVEPVEAMRSKLTAILTGTSPGSPPCGGVMPRWSAPASAQASASVTDCIV